MALKVRNTGIAAATISGVLVLGFRDSSLNPLVPASSILTLLVVFLFSAVVMGKSRGRVVASSMTNSITLLILLSFFTALLSGIGSDYIDLSLSRSLLIFSSILIVFIAASSSRDSLHLLKSSAAYITLIVTFVSLLAVFVYLFGSVTGGGGTGRSQSISLGPITISQSVMGIAPILRTGGLLGNPNSLAIWASFSLPLVFFLRGVDRIGKLRFLFSLVSLAAGVGVTISRTGIVLFFLSFAIIYVLSQRSASKRLAFSITALLLAAAGAAFILSMDVDSNRISLDLSGRDEIWSMLISSISDHPFLGVGFGVSTESIIYTDASTFEHKLSAHNFYLGVISEVGVIFAIPIISIPLLLTIRVFYIWKNHTSNNYIREASSCLLSYFIILMIYSLVEFKIFRFSAENIWFFLVAACVSRSDFWRSLGALGDGNLSVSQNTERRAEG